MSKKDLMTIDLNLTDVTRMINGMAEAGKDTSPLMRKIAGLLAATTALNFRDQGNPPWEPSAAAQARTGETLSLSGHLRRSITEKYDAGHAMVGTNVEYGVTHQMGLTLDHKSRPSRDKRKPDMMTKAWKQAFPARPFLPVDADGNPQKGLEQKILTLATDFLREAANGRG